MGWPLTGVVTALTVWMVRRANKAIEVAIERGDIVPKTEKSTGDPDASDANSQEPADHAAEIINDGDQNQ